MVGQLALWLTPEGSAEMYPLRYLISMGLTITACSTLYTLVIMWCLTEFFPLERTPYWTVYGILYVIITASGLKFYIPRLRDIW